MASSSVLNSTFRHHSSPLAETESDCQTVGRTLTATMWTAEETTVSRMCESDTTVPVTDSLVLNGVPNDTDLESKLEDTPTDSETKDTNGPENSMQAVSNIKDSPRPSPKIKQRPDERIVSIMNNPFYKSFGTKPSRSPRAECPSLLKGGKMSVDYEDLGEYKPGSGYVHKLSGRFASLAVKDPPLKAHRIKHASSYDNIIDEKVYQQSEIPHQDIACPWSQPLQHRVGSVDCLNPRKAPPVFPVSLRHVVPKEEHSAPPVKSPRETHVEAPDMQLAREDIILIENPPQLSALENDLDRKEDEDGDMSVGSGIIDEAAVNELPKPNTVSSVRSLFESGKAAEAPTVESESSCLSAEFAPSPRKSSFSSNPSPKNTVSTDTDIKNIPAQETSFPFNKSSSRNYSTSDVTLSNVSQLNGKESDSIQKLDDPMCNSHSILVKDTHVAVESSEKRLPQDASMYIPMSSSSTPSSAVGTEPLDSEMTVNEQSPQAPCSESSSFRPAIPPRSTATVKAIPVSKPVISSSAPTFVNISRFNNSSVPPPSFKPSIKRSSPVVHVAPFKENKPLPEDENRHLIYTKKKSSGTKKKVSRVKDYGEISVDSNNGVKIKEKDEVIKINEDDLKDRNETKLEQTKDSVSPVPETSEEKEENRHTEVKTQLTLSEEREENVQKSKVNIMTSEPSEEVKDEHAHTGVKETESELNASELSESDHEPENQWRVALKPVSRRMQDKVPVNVKTGVVEVPKLAPRPYFSRVEAKSESGKTKSVDQIGLQSITHEKQEKKVEKEVVKVETGEVKMEDTDSTSIGESSTETSDSGTGTKEAADEPIRGIPSIIANRMKKNNQGDIQNGSTSQTSAGSLFGVQLGKTRHDTDNTDSSGIPYKRPTPSHHDSSKDTVSSEPTEVQNQFANVLKRKQHSNKNRSTGVSEIFDSSKLQKKRREKKAAAAKAEADANRTGTIKSADGTTTVKSCNIEFIGANITTGRSLLAKNRKMKISVSFHDILVQTFQYPSEEQMLEDYVRDHPDEVVILEEECFPAGSSDDSVDVPANEGSLLTHDTDLLRSNTSLAHSGNLQSYRSRFQQDYEMGSVFNVPEKEPEPPAEVDPIDQDSMQIVPAADEELLTYSVDTSSDLLF